MIYMVTGKIGGGKTLLMLTKILEHLGRGGCVVGNIALDEREVDLWMRDHYRRRLVDRQIRFYDFEAEPEFQKTVLFGVPTLPVWVVVDEAQLYYNAANAAQLTQRLMRLLSFLTQSRKCSVDVWLITQHDTTIWAQFRHQCLFGYKCRDMRGVNLPFVGALPFLGLTWVKYDIMSAEILERGSTRLDRRLFRLYDTRQMYDSQMRELQAAAEIWNPPARNHKGKFENEAVLDTGFRGGWARCLRMARSFLVGRQDPSETPQSGAIGNAGES